MSAINKGVPHYVVCEDHKEFADVGCFHYPAWESITEEDVWEWVREDFDEQHADDLARFIQAFARHRHCGPKFLSMYEFDPWDPARDHSTYNAMIRCRRRTMAVSVAWDLVFPVVAHWESAGKVRVMDGSGREFVIARGEYASFNGPVLVRFPSRATARVVKGGEVTVDSDGARVRSGALWPMHNGTTVTIEKTEGGGEES